MPDHKAHYRELCKSNESVPLHLRPRWLDAVCGKDDWDVALATDGGKRVTGVMPYFQTRRWGMPVIQLPPLTSYGGPWLFYPQKADLKLHSRYSFENKTLTELLRKLPQTVFFQQNFRPEIQNWLPFRWAGFRQSTRYTYVLDPVKEVGEFSRSLTSGTRKKIKQAGEQFSVAGERDLGLLYDFYQLTCQRRGIRPGADFTVLTRLYQALDLRGQCELLVARRRSDNQPMAAQLITNDGRQASLLLGGQAIGRDTGHLNYLMLYESVRQALLHGQSVDFEGSMDPGVEQVFRSFGGRMVPYFQVWKIF